MTMFSPKKFTVKALGVALCLPLLLTACDQKPAETKANSAPATTPSSTTSTNAVAPSNPNQPTYIVNLEGTYPPFNMRDEKGQVIGLEADLLRAIGQKQGFNVTLLSHPWDGLFDTLKTKQGDIVASGIFATPERVQALQAIRPYMKSLQGAYVKTTSGITSIDGLKGKKVGGQEGTVSFDESLKQDVLKGTGETVSFKTDFLALQALNAGKVDAIYGESAVLNSIIKGEPTDLQNTLKFIPFENDPHPRYIGFFVAKDRKDDLAKKLNDGLQQISDDGTYAKIMQKWTGEKTTTLPPADVLNTIQ